MIDVQNLNVGQNISFKTSIYQNGHQVDISRENATIDDIQFSSGHKHYVVVPENPNVYWLPLYVKATEIHAVDGVLLTDRAANEQPWH